MLDPSDMLPKMAQIKKENAETVILKLFQHFLVELITISLGWRTKLEKYCLCFGIKKDIFLNSLL